MINLFPSYHYFKSIVLSAWSTTRARLDRLQTTTTIWNAEKTTTQDQPLSHPLSTVSNRPGARTASSSLSPGSKEDLCGATTLGELAMICLRWWNQEDRRGGLLQPRSRVLPGEGRVRLRPAKQATANEAYAGQDLIEATPNDLSLRNGLPSRPPLTPSPPPSSRL